MNICEPIASEDISETAKRMVALAKDTERSVRTKFNGITLNYETHQILLKSA